MKYLVLSLLLLSSVSCSPSKNKKQIVKSYYPNGKVRSITETKNGEKNGKEELYMNNGDLYMVQYFKNDLPVDSFYQYENGKVLFKGYCTPLAHVVTLYADGKREFAENDFKAKMIADGFVKVYYDNGNIMGMTDYKDGKKNGIDITYYRNGNIKGIQHYKSGARVPPILEFDTSGKIIESILVKD